MPRHIISAALAAFLAFAGSASADANLPAPLTLQLGDDPARAFALLAQDERAAQSGALEVLFSGAVHNEAAFAQFERDLRAALSQAVPELVLTRRFEKTGDYDRPTVVMLRWLPQSGMEPTRCPWVLSLADARRYDADQLSGARVELTGPAALTPSTGAANAYVLYEIDGRMVTSPQGGFVDAHAQRAHLIVADAPEPRFAHGARLSTQQALRLAPMLAPRNRSKEISGPPLPPPPPAPPPRPAGEAGWPRKGGGPSYCWIDLAR